MEIGQPIETGEIWPLEIPDDVPVEPPAREREPEPAPVR